MHGIMYIVHVPSICMYMYMWGRRFRYVIPSFDVLAVELRQMKTVGQLQIGQLQVTGEEKRCIYTTNTLCVELQVHVH